MQNIFGRTFHFTMIYKVMTCYYSLVSDTPNYLRLALKGVHVFFILIFYDFCRALAGGSMNSVMENMSISIMR